jgi:hypothetical protein
MGMKRLSLVAAVLMVAAVVGAQALANESFDFIIESRPGGLNWTNYGDNGFLDSSGNVNAPGCTPDIGARYGSTAAWYGPGHYAMFTFTPTWTSRYEIYLAWPYTAGQIATAVTLYTGSPVDGPPDMWGNPYGPQGVIYFGTMDMYCKNNGVWNLFTTQVLTAGTRYRLGIYGGYQTPYAGGVTPADPNANRVCAGAAKFTRVPDPDSLLALGAGMLGLLGFVRRKRP